MNSKVNNSRRAFLQKARDAAVASTAITWLSTSHMASAAAYIADSGEKQLKTFTQSQLLNLKAIAQTIIPATDTPGAGDVDCHGFIDHQLATSQVGATQALNYVAVPGSYKGSVPLEDGAKGEGALDYYS